MAVSKTTNSGAKQAPKTEAKQAPKNEPKKPEDNKAAKQAPKETKAAAKNAFGDVPKNAKNDNAKQPDNAPKNSDVPKTPDNSAKQPVAAPKEAAGQPKEAAPPAADSKTAPPANDAKAAPAADPKGTAPAPADGKAAPAPADGKPPPAATDGNTTVTTIGKTPFGNPANPKMNNIVADGKIPPADSKAVPAPAEGKAAPDPATDYKAPPAADPKTTPDTDPKAAPATDPKATPGTDAKAPLPAVDPKVQEILDTKLADGKTVKEKIDADAPAYVIKAAQDHYNQQAKNGEEPDAVSKFYLNNLANDIAKNGSKESSVSAERMAGVFNTDQINKNIEDVVKDPGFIKWAGEQQANSIQNTIEKNPDIAKLVDPYLQPGENQVNALRRMQSEYMGSPAFADGVAKANTPDEGKNLVNDGMNTLASLGLGEKEILGVGNTLTENIRAKYTPNAPKAVIDPDTNKIFETEDGNGLATLPDGTPIALDRNNQPVADKEGNAYVYNPDGTAKVDANSKYVQYDAKAQANYANYNGTKYMIGADGNGRFDAQNRPLAIDSGGGAPVALDKESKAVTDLAGNKLVFDPDTGKALTDPGSGNQVVIDPKTKGIVQTDIGGTIIAAKNGDPYAVDQTTGKFVQDAQGRYVQISKDNAAPGIVPGYVVDQNNTKIVVAANNGKPMVDPASGKTVILDPRTNAPQLVPLDANGAPKLASDGKNIIYNETGNTVVPNEGKGPDWLVNADGKYAQNVNGNYIGVDAKSGLAAPVDENGFVKNANGLTPLWDAKANAPMTTPDGNQVVIDDQGNLLMANAKEQTIVEEKSGLPMVIDPKTNAPMVNPDTGRTILADQGGALVEYNADDGYKYLINPETKTTVKTAEGNPVVTNETGIPYAVTPDGTVVKNPATGNAIAYGIDGKPAVEESTGYNVEITSSGAVHVIDPKTNAPMAELDPKTGGYQVYNTDGTAATNPDTGNKVQMVPDSGLKVEIDATTGKPVTDAKGNPLLLGPDNRPLKTPDGNAVVADLNTGVPVATGPDGEAILDPVSKLPQAVNAETGVPLADPDTKAAVVVDPKSRQPVQVDAIGNIVTDPVTGMPVAVNAKTGAQVKGPDGELAVNDPRTGLPVYYDQQSKLFTVTDPDTGKAVVNPETGAKTVIDVGSGQTFEVLPDAQGNQIIVDENGQPVKDDNGNQPWFDKETGAVVMVNDKGEIVDPQTGKKPEAFDPKNLAYTVPVFAVPPSLAMILAGGAKKRGASEADLPDADLPDDDMIVPAPYDDGAGVNFPPGAPGPTSPSAAAPSQYDYPWENPNYKMTPQERAEFITQWESKPGRGPISDWEKGFVKKLKQRNPAMKDIPAAELMAVRSYTKSSWWPELNQAMYTRDPALLNKHSAFIKAVKSGLTHLREAGYGYQGPSTRFFSLSKTKFIGLFGGETYTNRQFMSTAMLNATDMRFEYKNTKLKVNHLTGVDISAISHYPAQREVIADPGVRYELSKFKPAEEPSGFFKKIKLRNKQKATLSEVLPKDYRLLGGNPDFGTPGPSRAMSNWAKLGKAIGYGGQALEVVGGGAQVVFGGLQIDKGIKGNDPYDIAAGSLNVASGALALGSAGVAFIGGAAAGLAVPLMVGSIVAGTVAEFIDLVGSLDDDEKFADDLEKKFGPLGILQDGWRPKAEKAYEFGNKKHYTTSIKE